MSINLTQRRRNGIETKERLLQSTESLFASGGFAGLTMREVASLSHTNIASAHYHFGSKEAMVLEMLKTRIGPINAKRMKYLSEAKEAKAGKPLSTFEIFRALILPIGEEISKKRIPEKAWLNSLPEALPNRPASSRKCISASSVNSPSGS